MIRLNSSLVSIAAEFCGKYSPYQAIEISPAAGGGVYVTSTDGGRVVCLAHDPAGICSEVTRLLPDSELLRYGRGIKTADRELTVNGNNAVVTTFRKTTSEKKEFTVTHSISDSPPLAQAVKACIDKWSPTPTTTSTAGRYESAYVERALKGLAQGDGSVVMSAFDGGPMRLQTDRGNVVILVMPQTAEPIPPIPDWLINFAKADELVATA